MFRNHSRLALVASFFLGIVVSASFLLTLSPTHSPVASASPALAADTCQTFPETGFQVCGRFLDYWNSNGGLTQQGLPISNVFDEQNAPPPSGDGKIHKVQYFQRARFEQHLENQPPYDVLLGLIGSEQYGTKYGQTTPVPNGASLLAVNGKSTQSMIGIISPRTGYTFLVLNITLTNSTSTPLTSNPFNFKVSSSAGSEYEYSAATSGLDGSLQFTTLQPGQSVSGKLAFEVPSNETILSLSYEEFSNKVAIKL